MDNLRILDCTLRDGGRVINCNFGKDTIQSIFVDLQDAGVDIIEIGFIRNNMEHSEGSTFFTNMEQIKEYVVNPTSEIVVFVDCGMFDSNLIPTKSIDNPVSGIRVGFKKSDWKKAITDIKVLKDKGYKVYAQAIDTLGYSDAELAALIDDINELEPYAFAIVDTYGAMYREDVIHYFELFNRLLNKNICIDFHSHNNFQLSFSLAQEVVSLAEKSKDRDVIIDATLYGMGKVAGNLNTELIVEYLNKKYDAKYVLHKIFDCIDENIMGIYKKNNWGYSCNGLLSGIYRAHPNNVLYLTEKFKLDTNDVDSILALIDEQSRRTYDYDNIERCYIEYNASKQDDVSVREKLKCKLTEKKILLIAPGASLKRDEVRIKDFIAKEQPVVVAINFEHENIESDYIFFANQKRYKKYKNENDNQIIISSNVKPRNGKELIVNYDLIVQRGWKNFDNAMIMFLRLLKNMDVKELYIAGFDGFDTNVENFVHAGLEMAGGLKDYKKINAEICVMFANVKKEYVERGINISFLTDSIYDV